MNELFLRAWCAAPSTWVGSMWRRLSSVVCELKSMGWPIERLDIPSPTDRKFNRIIGLYRLPQIYIVQALAMRSAV